VLLLRPFWSYELRLPCAPEQRPIRKPAPPVDGSDLSREASRA
jgi:hypothetical protein